jgi:hypothetical protein
MISLTKTFSLPQGRIRPLAGFRLSTGLDPKRFGSPRFRIRNTAGPESSSFRQTVEKL